MTALVVEKYDLFALITVIELDLDGFELVLCQKYPRLTAKNFDFTVRMISLRGKNSSELPQLNSIHKHNNTYTLYFSWYKMNSIVQLVFIWHWIVGHETIPVYKNAFFTLLTSHESTLTLKLTKSQVKLPHETLFKTITCFSKKISKTCFSSKNVKMSSLFSFKLFPVYFFFFKTAWNVHLPFVLFS